MGEAGRTASDTVGPTASISSGNAAHGAGSSHVWSKMEINLMRLLSRCEERAAREGDSQLAQDPKLHTFLAVLRSQLAALSGDQSFADEGRQQPPLISGDRLASYRMRIEVLAARLGGQLQADLWAPPGLDESSGGQLEEDKDEDVELEETPEGFIKVTRTGRDAAQASLACADTDPASLLRRRRPRTAALGLAGPVGGPDTDLAGTASVSSTDSLSLSGSARALLEQQRDIQEDLADSMLALARQLKANSVAMGDRVRGSEKVIDAASVLAEGNLAQASRAKARAGEVYTRGWCTSCWTWLVMIVLVLVFMGMILFMKIT